MVEICTRSFIINPPEDLLKQYPQIKRATHELALSFAHNELVTDERLMAIGSTLWLSLGADEAFEEHLQYAGNKALPIIIESDNPVIQSLPWEILHHPSYDFLGREVRFSLSRRIPLAEVEPSELHKGPLRVLLFTSLPENLDAERGRLAVEEEQEHVLEALIKPVLDGIVELQMPDDGRFTTLKRQLRDFQPHLVFLSGHGKFYQSTHDDTPPYGSFLFEDEHGFGDPVNDSDLAKAFTASGVQCVVLSACESGKAASDALFHSLIGQLIQQHIPHVVGMRESVLDRAGILFAQYFCDAIGRHERVDIALQQARNAITQPLKDATYRDSDKSGINELSLGQWSLPTLYSRDAGAPLIDWEFDPCPPQPEMGHATLEGVSLPEKFRGRRRELRQLGARLRNDEIKQLLITGPGGQGKTALAGKLALGMQQQGWKTLAWSAKEGKAWAGFLLDLQLMLNKDNGERYDRVKAQVQDPREQVRYLLELLLSQLGGRLVILLDNLESLQDGKGLALTDEKVQDFVAAAQRLGDKGLILLVTSRWLLPDWPQHYHWPLEHFNFGDFLQLCLLLNQQLAPLAKRRLRLRKVYEALNGNGRGLNFFAAAVQGMALEEEETFLEALSKAETEVQTDMALRQVLTQRSDEQLELLWRVQWYEAPVPIEGVLKLADGLEKPQLLLAELVAVSLVEKSYNPQWLCVEYYCPAIIARAVNEKLQRSPDMGYAESAADYQAYLFRNERPTLNQAQTVHSALKQAALTDRAHRFALDNIIGSLQRKGLFQTLLDEWLPVLCDSADKQISAMALRATANQYFHLGQYQKALSYSQQSLAIIREISNRSEEGVVLNAISSIYQEQGNYEMASSHLKQALAISQEIGNRDLEGTTFNNMGTIAQVQGDFETALSYYNASLLIRKVVEDRYGYGTTLSNIASIALAQGDYETALDYWKQSIEISQERKDRADECAMLNNISQIYKAQGDFETALNYLKQSLAISQEIGYRKSEAVTLNNISQICSERGDFETALNYLKQSLAISQEIEDSAEVITTLVNISSIYKKQGDYETALSHLKQALGISQEIKNPSLEGKTLAHMAEIAHVRYDDDTALSCLKKAIEIQRAISDRAGEGITLKLFSQIYKARKDYETALNYAKQALAILETEDRAEYASTLDNISQIYKAQRDYDRALSYSQRSLSIRKEMVDRSGEAKTLINISSIYQDQGDYETALSYAQQSLAIRKEIVDPSGEAETIIKIASIYQDQGDYETALSHLTQALATCQKNGYRVLELSSLNQIAKIALSRGDDETALSLYTQALAICQKIGFRALEGVTLEKMAEIVYSRGDDETALGYFKESLAISREFRNRSEEGKTLNKMGFIAQTQGDDETALSYFKESLAISREVRDRSEEATVLNNISSLYKAQGDIETALSYLEQALAIQQKISDVVGLCSTFFNMGNIYHQIKQGTKAYYYWLKAYNLSKSIGHTQVLGALETLAGQLDELPGDGLAAWEALAKHMQKTADAT